MNEQTIKIAVADVMSDFYNNIIKKRFDTIEAEITNLRLTSDGLLQNVKAKKAFA